MIRYLTIADFVDVAFLYVLRMKTHVFQDVFGILLRAISANHNYHLKNQIYNENVRLISSDVYTALNKIYCINLK